MWGLDSRNNVSLLLIQIKWDANIYPWINYRNLHAAVGCYFDFYSGKLPSMQIVADVTVGEGEAVTPNTWLI